jgi:peptidylprolyl isomerase domain and WD repeat-containing protein 1
MKNPQGTGGTEKITTDPLIIASAFKKNRFYLFSRREPEDSKDKNASCRDIFNERPNKEDQHFIASQAK